MWNESKKEILTIEFDDWKVIEDLLEVFGAMYSIIVEVSSEKKVTASKIVPLSKLLLIRYRNLRVDSRFSEESSVGKLVRDMLINMEKRLLTTENNATLYRYTMFDPRFRDFEKTFCNMNHVEINKIEFLAECKKKKTLNPPHPQLTHSRKSMRS
ncbi:unnamed protein product [Lepeophtheirus salmonis]|uniref:(salmon louse) hypothetical protein n=1 Tax=Lepeophtheirus salmonis TaxID=72036 RepID=A0A7R8H8Z4_LEPSM|nr:unnamed protein product [Lepeophtheirus salmonis]CAF2950417.1 unnamed protein product [Lepeophtheirus salmonis]